MSHLQILQNPTLLSYLEAQATLPLSSPMAAFANNTAATFTGARSESTSAVASPLMSPRSLSVSLAATPLRPISVSWNPHSALCRSRRSSLLNLYGAPGPLRPFPATTLMPQSQPTVSIGHHLPTSTLSYLNDHGKVRTVSLSDLTRGRKAVILAVPGAFVPPQSHQAGVTAEELVRRAAELREKGGLVELVVVAVNDVYVMRAWGERLGSAAAGVRMLSDPEAELAAALGLAVDMRGGADGFGVRSEGYCMVVVNGMVRAMFRNNMKQDVGGGGGGSATIAGFDDVIKVV